MNFVNYEVTDHVAVITLNRPERLNAMSVEMYDELKPTLRRFMDDDDAWVMIITGTGRAFCAGRDLKAQAASGKAPEPSYSEEWNIFGMPTSEKPLIAAVNGWAIGAGWYMAAGCDIRVAAESAKFGMGEIPTGVLGPYWFPVAEGLPWCIGAEFTLIGENIPSRRLLELGLVNEVVEDGQTLEAAWRWARKFLALPPQHIRRTKRLMLEMRRTPDKSQIEREMEARRYLNPLADTIEAAAAFAEKRPPVFIGR